MQRAEKKPYHHGDLREALLSATEQVLGEVSLDQLSLREIARRAGVSHAAPKHHFGSLGGLLGEVAALGFRRFTADMVAAEARVQDPSPEAKLRASARSYVRFAAANPAIYGLMFGKRAEVEVTPALMEASMASWNKLEEDLTEIVGPSRAANAALMVWSSCHGLSMLLLDARLPPHLTPDQAIENIVGMILAGLKADV
jgi:AcrR family transcriptional regulator